MHPRARGIGILEASLRRGVTYPKSGRAKCHTFSSHLIDGEASPIRPFAGTVLVECTDAVEVLAAPSIGRPGALAVIAAEYAAHTRAPTERKKPLTADSWFLSRTLTLVAGEMPVQFSRWSRPVAVSVGTYLPAFVWVHATDCPQWRHSFTVSRRVKVRVGEVAALSADWPARCAASIIVIVI